MDGMKPMCARRVLRAAALLSSVLLLSAYVAYQSGCVSSGSPKAAQTSASDERDGHVSGSVGEDAVAPSEPKDTVVLPSSKSREIVMPGSKSSPMFDESWPTEEEAPGTKGKP